MARLRSTSNTDRVCRIIGPLLAVGLVAAVVYAFSDIKPLPRLTPKEQAAYTQYLFHKAECAAGASKSCGIIAIVEREMQERRSQHR